MSQANLRNSSGNPYLYLEGTSGSTAVGLNVGDSDKFNIVVTSAASDIDPTSGTPSISINPSVSGNITISPQLPSGESIFTNGDVVISAGNLQMHTTSVGGAEGVIELGAEGGVGNPHRFIHAAGTNNTFIGKNAGNLSTTSNSAVAVGANALQNDTSLTGMTAVGFNALNALSAGVQNTAVGYEALQSATSANQNTAVGYQALTALTAPGTGGGLNAAFGNASLRANTVGRFNTALGCQALVALNGNGHDVGPGNDLFNTAVGCESGWAMTSGTNNTLVGAQAGVNTLLASGLLTGNANTIIGAHSGENYTGSESANILIFNSGVTGENNTIRIGDGSTQTRFFATGVNGTSVTATGTVVIDASGQLGTRSGFSTTWNDITAASATMAVNNGYVADRATLVTLTLPSTAAFGSRIEIVGKGAGGWTIAQNAGQTIHFSGLNSTTGAGGSLSSTQRYDCVELICVTANTDFVVKSSIGNITVV